MAAREIRIRASAVGTRKDGKEVLSPAAGGKLRCLASNRELEQVNAALDKRLGAVSGRLVLSLN